MQSNELTVVNGLMGAKWGHPPGQVMARALLEMQSNALVLSEVQQASLFGISRRHHHYVAGRGLAYMW